MCIYFFPSCPYPLYAVSHIIPYLLSYFSGGSFLIRQRATLNIQETGRFLRIETTLDHKVAASQQLSREATDIHPGSTRCAAKTFWAATIDRSIRG